MYITCIFWFLSNLSKSARARTFKHLGEFFSAYFFQECQEKCSSAINEVNIDLLYCQKSGIFSQKARARTFAQIT